MRAEIFYLCLTALLSATAIAQDESADVAPPNSGARLDLHIVDLPFNTVDGYQAPSMAQALHLTKSVYQGAHYQMSRLVNPNGRGWAAFGGRMALLGIDSVLARLPLGDSWMHEEWHRAVMTRRKISSYNGVYDFASGDTIPVRKVKDEDLIRLKADHPAEQVRLSAAGMESQHELAFALESDIFFGESRIWMGTTLLYSHLSPILYMDACTQSATDKDTAEMNEKEVDIEDRDFTGFDCIAWAYDLFRPEEPYEARGVHPSGVGVDRYRTVQGLTSAERRYLVRARNRSWLNLIDPFLFDANHFALNETPLRFNANLRHHLTSFGEAMDLNLFAKLENINLLLIFHAYQNREAVFPGFELRLIRMPMHTMGLAWALTPRIMFWEQPQHQSFYAKKSKTGGLLGLRFETMGLRATQPFIELEVKDEGWVPGIVYLDKNVSVRSGLSLRLE